MWWLVGITLVSIFFIYKKRKQRASNLIDYEYTIEVEGNNSNNHKKKTVIYEYLNDEGIPCFLYRFSAHLDFTTSAEALNRNGEMVYLERPGGNSDGVYDSNGYWTRISNEFQLDNSAEHYLNERYKYIGGVKGYIKFLLGIRQIYENKEISADQKREQIKLYCEEHKDAYLSRTNYREAWDTLIIEVISTIPNFGDSKVALLKENNIKTIKDINDTSDETFLSIRGIGKKTLSDLRSFAQMSPIDPKAHYIEVDPEYRSAGQSSSTI